MLACIEYFMNEHISTSDKAQGYDRTISKIGILVQNDLAKTQQEWLPDAIPRSPQISRSAQLIEIVEDLQLTKWYSIPHIFTCSE